MKKFFYILLLFIFPFVMFSLSAESPLSDVAAEGTISTQIKQTDVKAVSSVPVYDLQTRLPTEKDVSIENTKELSTGFWMMICDSFYTNLIKNSRWRYLFDGFIVTMEVSLASVLLGV